MRGKSKIQVEELNQRLKQLKGCPYEVDLRKMTLKEVKNLIWNNRFRVVENLKKAKAEGTVIDGVGFPDSLLGEKMTIE